MRKWKGRKPDHQVYVYLQHMKEVMGQLSADNIKILATDFDCDINSNSDGLTATDLNISTGSDAAFSVWPWKQWILIAIFVLQQSTI